MSYRIREIAWDQIDMPVAACMKRAWGERAAKSSEAEILSENRDFWSKQEAPLLLIAEDDQGHVAGYWFAYALPPQGRERILYHEHGGVSPDHRRKGIARALLREQHRLAKERGYTRIRTNTAVIFKPMIILNLQEGFDIVDLSWSEEFHVKVLAFEKRILGVRHME
ncbi:MAG: GNAT family N-acetyltransferase [Planctomycetes bacterium]|nr:GNAT family N-acetyltransferase [Planctomycetota bacterium]